MRKFYSFLQVMVLTFVMIFFTNQKLFSQNCSVNAGVPTTICQNESLILDGTKGGALFGDGTTTWS